MCNFNPCYPVTKKNFTTNKSVAEKWEKMGFTVSNSLCGGGIDDWEHQTYCGCAGDGHFRVNNPENMVHRVAPIEKLPEKYHEVWGGQYGYPAYNWKGDKIGWTDKTPDVSGDFDFMAIF